jgi:hypothetical protein
MFMFNWSLTIKYCYCEITSSAYYITVSQFPKAVILFRILIYPLGILSRLFPVILSVIAWYSEQENHMQNVNTFHHWRMQNITSYMRRVLAREMSSLQDTMIWHPVYRETFIVFIFNKHLQYFVFIYYMHSVLNLCIFKSV